MKHSYNRGFTIVELLIVIVVIGILAAITVVAYNGVTTKAENTKTTTAASQMVKLMEIIKAQTGKYPVAASSTTAELYPCVGEYPSSICASIDNVTAGGVGIAYVSTSFNATLKQYGSIPQPSTQSITLDSHPIKGVFVSLNDPTSPTAGQSYGMLWFLKGSNVNCGVTGAVKAFQDSNGARCTYDS